MKARKARERRRAPLAVGLPTSLAGELLGRPVRGNNRLAAVSTGDNWAPYTLPSDPVELLVLGMFLR